MTEALYPSRPPLGPCPGFERHDFAGHSRCRRPRCRRPHRHWSDYEYGRNTKVGRILKAQLYRWLTGELNDAELLDRLGGAFGNKRAQALLDSWRITRDGCDLLDLLAVDLWQARRGELRFRVSGRPDWYLLPAGPQGFAPDARALLTARPAAEAIQSWNDEAELLATWSADSGPRLEPLALPGAGACAYLRLPYPVHWLTTNEAANQLGYARSHVAHMVRIGHLPAQRPGKDHLIDPLYVAWLAARRKEATHRA